MSLRLPILFVLFALLPLAVLTQKPLAKPVASDDGAEFAAFDHTFFEAQAPLAFVMDLTLGAYEQRDGFAFHLDATNAATSMSAFDVWEAEPRVALFTLRALPDHREYVEWLSADTVGGSAKEPVVGDFVEPRVAFIPPILEAPSQGARATEAIPMYDVWVNLLRDQPRPKRADEFLPKLKRIFAEEGMPEELAWLPEIESMFDPRARNRVGARGLFQFMPGTALEQGLRLRPYDERTHPEKSARAAAVLLRRLHGVFDSWPLALAAYNAGESRVRRTLEAGDATTYAEIADALPIETRLYVPKVLATLAVREGLDPSMLAAPSLR